MKKLLLITILLLIQSFPSFGNPKNMGIICKCLECKLSAINVKSYVEEKKYPSEIGFFFTNKRVKRYFISIIKDKIIFRENGFSKFSSDLDYNVNSDKIEWGYLSGVTYRYIYNRQTQILKKRFNPTKTISTIRKCQKYNSFNKFKNKMNKIALQYQSRIF